MMKVQEDQRRATMNKNTSLWIDFYLSLSNAKDRDSISKFARRNPLRIFELVRQTVTLGSFSDEAETMTVSELSDLRVFAATLIAWIDIEFEAKKRRKKKLEKR